MQKKLTLAVIAVGLSALVSAQEVTTEGTQTTTVNESAFTFTEAQLGENDDMSQNVTIINASTNTYASQVGWQFSPVRFRYRAFNQRFNDVYINGAPVNDMESGQFRFSLIGGLNQQTRNVDFALPFEGNTFSMPNMGGSNNYNFRAGSMPIGQRAAVSYSNRNYKLRGTYSYASGFNEKGWALAGNITYRWADRGYAEGTFYNALSYFLAAEKRWVNGHSVSFATWGNPTERAGQGASTDEVYWLANDRYYNPYWGYQNGKVRNSRIVTDFAPAAVFTWDWKINDDMKLTTTLFGKYSMYKSTKLNYNNAENPQPDYWKNLPSSYFDVFDSSNEPYRSELALNDWNMATDYWHASKGNRQINWDRLYWANEQANLSGSDALYYVQAKHNDNLTVNLSSSLLTRLDKNKTWIVGYMLGQNNGRHYQTMDDLLGAKYFHNINTYALGTYAMSNPYVHYDLNTAGPEGRGKLIYEGDKFGYDYALLVHKATAWSSFQFNDDRVNVFVAGKVGGTDMQRKGYMLNGMFQENSYGKSGRAKFFEAGGKFRVSYDATHGHALSLGLGYESRAPQATTAFVAPEMNNDFVSNLANEWVFSSEFCYMYQNAWVHANLNAYYSRLDNVTEWQNFYFDDINSFSYVSMTDISKEYYGVELGLDFKLNSAFNIRALGTISDAKNVNNAKVWYLSSTKRTYNDANGGRPERVMCKGMREASTPLTAAALVLSYHQRGWFVDLAGKYYDRIYLSYSPSTRYESTLSTTSSFDEDGNFIIPAQEKGHGGFMLDGSIGHVIRIKRGQSLSINVMLNNLLNNQNIVTGGYEQSRSDYTVKDDGTLNNTRTYKFSRNPKKYYAMGINGMLNISYKF